MRESKAQLTDRLRREGRWDAFVRRREALKDQGTPAAEAWKIAAAEFGEPVKPASPETDACSSTPDLTVLRGKTAPILEAVRWTFEHLDATWVTPADAPSAGAWSLRESARINPGTRAEFYRTFVPRMLPTRQQIDREEEMQANDEPVLEMIAACRKAAEEVRIAGTDRERGYADPSANVARAGA